MAQAGFTPISLYYSTTAAATPSAGNLVAGELALNTVDEKLYFKNSAGTVKLLASNATSAPVLSFSAGTTGFTPNTATSGAVTLAGTLATTNGGTGLTSFTSGGVVYASSSSALATGSALQFDNTNLFKIVAATGIAYNRAESTQHSTFVQHFATSGGTGLEYKTLYRFVDTDVGELMRLNSTGLGIGTSSPTSKLTVAGAISVNTGAANLNALGLLSGSSGDRIGLSLGRTAQEAYIGIASTSNSIINGDVAGDLDILTTTGNIRFSTNAGASLQATLDTAGNLGVGVTPSAQFSGIKSFQVGSTTNLFDNGASTKFYHNAFTAASGNETYLTTGYAQGYLMPSNGQHQWYIAASGTAGNTFSFTQAMTLTAGGNLLVGTTTSNARLTISAGATTFAADIQSTGTNTYTPTASTSLVNSTLQLVGGNASGATTGIRMSQSSSFELFFGGVQESGGAGAFVFQGYNGSAYAERARIDSSGNLLVGTTSNPNDAKIVIGPTFNNGISIESGGTGVSMSQLLFRNPNGIVGSVTTSGTATNYNTSSDYRLKNTIAPMTGALAKVALLKPCTYKWNVDGSDGEGFIAHELAEVCPSAVTGAKDAVDKDGKPHHQGIDVSFLVATLTAAIQEQQAIIESLKARLDAANL
jgi:hypothetical protein